MANIRPMAQTSDAGASVVRPERTLVGTWRLLSWEARASDGTVSYPFGEQSVGYCVYTVDGHVFGQLMRPGRPSFEGGDILGGSAEENALALQGYIAYGSTYEIEDGTVVHYVEMSLFPNWIGGEQRRNIDWDADRLILTTPPIMTGGGVLVHRLTWERVLPRGGA